MKPDNVVLDSVYGYSMYKYYDFFNGKWGPGADEYFSDGEGNRVSGDGCFTFASSDASISLANASTRQVVKPVEMSNFYVQQNDKGIVNLRAGVNKTGLHNYAAGTRHFAIGDVKKGQIVVLQWGVSQGTNIIQPSSAISGAAACAVTDISEQVHADQVEAGKHMEWVYDEEQGEDVETEVSGKADNFTYWKIENDGYLVVEMQRYTCIQGLQIWLDASADEAVSAPTSKIVEVDGTSRKVEMTSGVSTLGLECQVWYGIEGEEALFLIDTEEVVKADTIYVVDEEGNPTSAIDHIDYTYKKIIDPEEWQTGIAGPNSYNDVAIEVSDQDDEDGDGYVTIHAATVSSKGNFSDIVDIKVAVNELTLNAPTLTLVGLEGLTRKYTLGWTNNTLCGEEYELYVTVDGTEQQYDLGAEIEAEETIEARAHVEGYNDGVMAEQDVLARDVEYSRKNAEAEADQHDWDFVHLTDVQYQMIRGEYSETYVSVIPNEQNPEVMDSIFYTRNEYLAKIESGELQIGDAVPYNTIDCGWWYDASKSRATLNVIEGGNDPNANGYGYVDDSYVQLFNNGLSFSCPPNANNASCLFIYTNNDLGVYFMARPTLTFDREAAKYGDYVLIYQGAGGSNYTNSRWPSLYEVPAEELLSVTLQNGGVHVFYIDVYSPAEAPEDPYTGISEVKVPASLKNVIFDLSGRRVQKAEKGIFIINGKKVIK